MLQHHFAFFEKRTKVNITARAPLDPSMHSSPMGRHPFLTCKRRNATPRWDQEYSEFLRRRARACRSTVSEHHVQLESLKVAIKMLHKGY